MLANQYMWFNNIRILGEYVASGLDLPFPATHCSRPDSCDCCPLSGGDSTNLFVCSILNNSSTPVGH